MKIRRILPLVFALTTAALAGCSADADSTDDSAADVSSTSGTIAASSLKIQKTDIAIGYSANDVMKNTDAKKTFGVGFDGKAGDDIDITYAARWTGTGYLYKEVSAGKLTLIQQVDKKTSSNAEIKITLRTAGHFVIAYTPAFKSGEDNVQSFTLALDGKSSDPAEQWVLDLKDAYENQSASDDFKDMDDSLLKGDAQKEFKKEAKQWGDDYPPVAKSWTFKGKKILIVEEDNDGGMTISFYDENGKYIAGGGQSESGDFSWD